MTLRTLAYGLILANLAAHLGGSTAVPARSTDATALFATRASAQSSAEDALNKADNILMQLDDATEYVKKFDVKSVDRDTLNASMKNAAQSLLNDYAETEYGLSPEDVQRLRSGQIVETKQMRDAATSAADVIAALEAAQRDLSAEEIRDLRSVNIGFEAKAMQTYLTEFHKQQTKSYKESLKLQTKNLKEQLQQVMAYYRKFPAMVISCT